MSNKLLLIDFEQDFFDQEFLDRLKKIFQDVLFISSSELDMRVDDINEVEIAVVKYFTKIDGNVLNILPNLKYIGASSVSVDQIDLNLARDNGVVVTNVAGYSSNSIAEFVFGVLISEIRNLKLASENVIAGDLIVHPEYKGYELKGKTLGILGLGNIGKRVGEIALGFGMKVKYFSRNRKPDFEEKGFEFLEKKDLLKTSDFIGVFLEFNEQTRGYISKDLIEEIKSGSVIISTSHTGVFDFDDFMNFIKNGGNKFIQAYFATIPDEHLEKMKQNSNVIIYPSIAIQTRETTQRQQELIVSNIESFLSGEVKNRVN